jgi:Spy/CpxP family protein refolding chaperone
MLMSYLIMNFKNVLVTAATGLVFLAVSPANSYSHDAVMAQAGSGDTPAVKDGNHRCMKIHTISPKFRQELGLTPDQETQLRAIRESACRQYESILTPEQKTQMRAIRKKVKEDTMAVLTPEQQQKLRQLYKERKWHNDQQ